MPVSVAIHAEDHAGRLSVLLLRQQSRLLKDQTWKGVSLPHGQNVSICDCCFARNFATHFVLIVKNISTRESLKLGTTLLPTC